MTAMRLKNSEVTETITVRLLPEIYSALVRYAREEKVSAETIIREAVRNYLGLA